jgi:hypothetical protein
VVFFMRPAKAASGGKLLPSALSYMSPIAHKLA